MAAPIAHVFLAIQFLAGPLQNMFNEEEFIVGTSFPDIRYLKVIGREETHFKDVSLQDIKKETNSFKAGMLFHSFVDEKREEYIVRNHFYEKVPNFRFTSQSLKFAEDQILMDYFDIKKYQSYFNKIYPEERFYKISDENLRSWHNFLQGYFDGSITGRDLLMKYFDLNEPNAWPLKRWFFSWFYARSIEQAISTILHDEEAKKLILDFYLNFTKNNS
jgi:hypothetical protein